MFGPIVHQPNQLHNVTHGKSQRSGSLDREFFCLPSNGIGSTSHVDVRCQRPFRGRRDSGTPGDGGDLPTERSGVELDLGAPWERIVKSIS